MPRVYKAEDQIRRAHHLGWRRGQFEKSGKSVTYRDTFYSKRLKRKYSFTILWKPETQCKVIIENPNPLPKRHGEQIPHLFDQTKQTVCLFRNVDGSRVEFDDSMPIVETLIPWLYEWIDTYECWLLSGIWQFPEHKHTNSKL